MKRFEIDTNINWLGPDKPAVYRFVLETMQLAPGERVQVFQDDDEWMATVRFDPILPVGYQWYVELDLNHTSR